MSWLSWLLRKYNAYAHFVKCITMSHYHNVPTKYNYIIAVVSCWLILLLALAPKQVWWCLVSSAAATSYVSVMKLLCNSTFSSGFVLLSLVVKVALSCFCRKVQTESTTGSVGSSRVRTTLTLCVETIDFDSHACQLRVKGTNIEENQYVKVWDL